MLLLKSLIPAAAVAGIVVGSVGTLKITKAVKPEIKLECPKCPDLKCPPASSIDFDKIKNVRGLTIQNHQYFVMGADTLSQESLVDAFRKVAAEQRLSRCK